MSRPIRLLAASIALIVLATGLAGCRPAKAGARCRTTELGRDSGYVLRCTNGRWKRWITMQQAGAALARLAPPTTAAPQPTAPPTTTTTVPQPARCADRFSGADLHDCDFRGAPLHGPGSFEFADLRYADLSGARLDGVTLFHANLTFANLTDASLVGTWLNATNLSSALLWHADLTNARLFGSNLNDALLFDAILTGARFEMTYVNRTQFDGVTSGGVVQVADPIGQQFTGTLPLVGGYLIVTGAKLAGVQLPGADLRGANLRAADLHGANLRGTRLDGATLSLAFLFDADLEGATLRNADLTYTLLDRVDLGGADLTGADFIDAFGAPSSDVGATYSGTACPDATVATSPETCW